MDNNQEQAILFLLSRWEDETVRNPFLRVLSQVDEKDLKTWITLIAEYCQKHNDYTFCEKIYPFFGDVFLANMRRVMEWIAVPGKYLPEEPQYSMLALPGKDPERSFEELAEQAMKRLERFQEEKHQQEERRKMRANTTEKIGEICLDSGSICIGDPCYFWKRKDEEELVIDRLGIGTIEELTEQFLENEDYPRRKVFDEAVAVIGSLDDWNYPISVTFAADGDVAEITISVRQIKDMEKDGEGWEA